MAGVGLEVGLLSEGQCAMMRVIDRRCVYGPVEAEWAMQRRVAKVVAAVALGVAQFGFVPIDLALGGDDVALGWALAAADTLGFGALEVWAMFELIDDVMVPLSDEEAMLLKPQLSGRARMGILVSSVAIGVLTQVPLAYVVYVFNERRLFFPIAMLFSESILPSLSLKMSFEDGLKLRRMTSFEKELQKVRGAMIGLVEQNRALFEAMDDERKTEFIHSFEQIKAMDDCPERFAGFMRSMLADPEGDEDGDGLCVTGGRYFFGANGGHFSLAYTALQGIMAYKAAGALFTGPAVCAAAATVMVVSNIYLNGTAIVKTAMGAFDGLYGWITGTYQKSLAEQLDPKLTFMLEAVGLTIASLAWGVSVEIAQKFLPDGGFNLYLQVTCSLGVVLFVSMAMMKLASGIVEEKQLQLGTPQAKSFILMRRRMKELVRLLKNSPFVEFARMLRALPEEHWAGLIEDMELIVEQVDDYLRREEATELVEMVD